MDAFLIALLGCLLAETGGQGQRLVLALATRFQRGGAVVAGVAAAAIVNAGIAALAGSFIAPFLGSDARLLFLALALLFLAGGMVLPVKQPDPLAGWTIGPFPVTALGLIILGFGEGAQFLILGVAIRTGDPLLAAAGGATGIFAAAIPVLLLRDRFFHAFPHRAVRILGGVVILLAAVAMAVSALHLG